MNQFHYELQLKELEEKLAAHVRLSNRLGKRLISLSEAIKRRFRYNPAYDAEKDCYRFLKASSRQREFYGKPKLRPRQSGSSRVRGNSSREN